MSKLQGFQETQPTRAAIALPVGFTTGLALSNDNKYLYASYPMQGGVYIFDVEEMIKTIEEPSQYQIDNLDRGLGSPFFNPTGLRPATREDLGYVPIDDINPYINVAANLGILDADWARNQFIC